MAYTVTTETTPEAAKIRVGRTDEPLAVIDVMA